MSLLKLTHKLMSEHPNNKYCVHDIMKIFNVSMSTSSSALSDLVRRNAAIKTFKQSCTSGKTAHFFYRYAGKIGKPHRHKQHNHAQQNNPANNLLAENRKLKMEIKIIKDMLKDELRRI